ncbi:MAG: hypothetical protein ACYSR1_08045, partial [Planctomycetota bacterium]
MEPLSEELVDNTWKELSGFTSEEAYEESAEVSINQPEIISFIVELTEDFDREVKELAIYLFFVIYRMFQNGYGKEIRQVTSSEIITSYEKNEKLIA